MCVNGPIDDATSNVIVAQLLYLESQQPEKPVRRAAPRGSGLDSAALARSGACVCTSWGLLVRTRSAGQLLSPLPPPNPNTSHATNQTKLEQLNKSKPNSNTTKQIFMYINSPGGVVTAGLAVYDTMQYVRSPISTLCVGQAASMASLLLAAGAPGERRCLPHARIMVHQPIGGAQGQASDILIQAKEIERLRDLLVGLYERHTGRAAEEVARTLDRDFYMDAAQAKGWGIVDEVIDARPAKSVVER